MSLGKNAFELLNIKNDISKDFGTLSQNENNDLKINDFNNAKSSIIVEGKHILRSNRLRQKAYEQFKVDRKYTLDFAKKRKYILNKYEDLQNITVSLIDYFRKVLRSYYEINASEKLGELKKVIMNTITVINTGKFTRIKLAINDLKISYKEYLDSIMLIEQRKHLYKE